MAGIVLNVEKREKIGTGGARATRNSGRIPGVLYGGTRGSIPIEINAKDVETAIRSGKFISHLIELRERVLPTVDRIAAQHPGEQIMLVTHGGVIDVLYRAAAGMDLSQHRTWELTNTAVNRLLWSSQGLTILAWGDTSHLTADSRDELAA